MHAWKVYWEILLGLHFARRARIMLICSPLNVKMFQRWGLSFFLNPAGICLLKVNNRKTRAKVWNMFKVNNNDTKTTPSSVFIVNFEHVITGWECFKNRLSLLRGISIFSNHWRNLIEAHLRHYQTTMVESLSVLHQFCNMLYHRCLKGLQPGIAYLYPRKTLENL